MLNDKRTGRPISELPLPNPRLVLTVVTPCLNSAQTIGDTLQSVAYIAGLLELRDLALEHCLIDGGSRDGTLGQIQAYCTAHTYASWKTGIKGGPYAAMNVGLAAAKGQFIHILNADDFIVDPEAYLTLLLNGISSGAKFLIGSIAYFRRPSLRIRSVWEVKPLPVNSQCWRRRLRLGLHYPHPGFIAEANLYKKAGFDRRYSLSADYKLMQSLLLGIDSSEHISISTTPIVAMAEGGATSSWQSIVTGYFQLRAINRELGITAPAWRRYLGKAISRRLQVWLRCFFKPAAHRG